jgi:hypothetical protein
MLPCTLNIEVIVAEANVRDALRATATLVEELNAAFGQTSSFRAAPHAS